MPAQTRNYVRAITGRSVDEWAALGREGGKAGIAKPTSCRQLAGLLRARPSFVIGKVERKAGEPTLRPLGIPDWRNASSGQSGTRRAAAPPTRSLALARTRNPSQVRMASLPATIRQPRTSLLAAAGKSEKSAGATSTLLSNSGRASGRLPASSPNGTGREHSATRVAARPTAIAAARNRSPLQVRAASLPTTEGATRRPKTSPSATASKNSSAAPSKSGKSTGAAWRARSVASTLSSKPASGRERAVSSELVAREKVAEDRLRKIMQICRGC